LAAGQFQNPLGRFPPSGRLSPKLALALRSSCDGHHKKALFIAELRKKNRAFLTAPALAGISSDLMQSHWTKALLRNDHHEQVKEGHIWHCHNLDACRHSGMGQLKSFGG
jgi:hypothetical protein